MNWTKKDIEKLQQSKLSDLSKKQVMRCITSQKEKENATISKKAAKTEKISVEKETIKRVLWVLHREGKIPEYVEELQFHPKRKWRFDWAIPSLMLAIEYEGVFNAKKGKSRHTTVMGYTGDCDKYNAAVKLGWRVLRYTAKNYQDLHNDLLLLIKK